MVTVNMFSSVKELKGVGDAKAAALARLGISTVYDLLHYFPRAYQNRGNVVSVAEVAMRIRQTGEIAPASLILTVGEDAKSAMIKRGMVLTKFKAYDESGVCEVTFFNQGYLKDTFRKGAAFRFWCSPTYEYGRLKLNSPAYEMCIPGRQLDGIVPVYPLTRGLSQKAIAALVREAMRVVGGALPEHLPPSVMLENNIASHIYSIKNIHFPESLSALYAARRRFDFDRIFTTSLALALRTTVRSEGAPKMENTDYSSLVSELGFELTGAQKRSAAEIAADMAKTRQMCRILCGDVGSGKTAVAAIALYIAVNNGYQAALMVPTEILAKQHYSELCSLFERLGYKCELLVGSLTPSKKRELQNKIAQGEVDLVIGTHALIGDKVSFKSLGLVITDEQHRFGANQRAKLGEKASCAHTLVMSATPIPRTLSLVYYGDLDKSILDELPPGRKKVSTFKVDESYRTRLEGFIRKQAEEKSQVYVVCPAIEENERIAEDADNIYDIDFYDEAKNEPPIKGALEYAAKLSEKLAGVRVGVVHGKMKTAEKDAVMADFSDGKIDVLVSTTVIEVGVNVPSATLMVVENAERFGLSQLHQLRGRVGRGNKKSYCILVSDTKNETSRARLDVLCKESNGYSIAEADLKLRGPGDFFASGGVIRQSGAGSLLPMDGDESELYEKAIIVAKNLAEEDPSLASNENALLRSIASKILRGSENTVN